MLDKKDLIKSYQRLAHAVLQDACKELKKKPHKTVDEVIGEYAIELFAGILGGKEAVSQELERYRKEGVKLYRKQKKEKKREEKKNENIKVVRAIIPLEKAGNLEGLSSGQDREILL